MKIAIGVIVILLVAILFMVLTCRSKNNDLYRWLGIGIFVAFCLTWIIPYGYFQEGSFYEYGMQRLGLSDIPTIIYYAIYFCLTAVIYLLAIGGLYGLLSKNKSYSALVKKCADKIKGKEIVTSVILIVLLVLLTAFLKTTWALMIFIPFIISVLSKAKYDKITTMGLTFGSILVGNLFAVYGTDGLGYFNSYMQTKVTVGIKYRIILGAIALILFVAYNIIRITRNKKNKKLALETAEDNFEVVDPKAKDKAWPIITIFGIVIVFLILCFIDWEGNFNITCFNKFHEWLTGLSIGKDFNIFAYILGTNSLAMGKMELSALIVIVLILSLIVALMNKAKFNEVGKAYGDGIMRMVKPVSLYTMSYFIFIVAYMTPFMATATNWAFGLTKSFNPYIATLTGFVTSIFHADLGYTSYIVGSLFTASYASNFSLLHTIYVTTYGLVQIFIPTSGMLLLGLSYSKLNYKSWFKYIWIFALAMLIILLLFVTIVAYAL